jgi:indolepyruvate ferredoxin oxidoreductase alpha subunit
MDKLLLLGDEAVAQGALDAGISGVYAYPGTPSSEITEYIQRSSEAEERGVQRKWCVNEKTSMEAALGMSYAGKRALVCMKHVGINVAADPFVNSAITGANGGIVLTVADDPSMHSSQNEQDSRFYSKFAMVPLFEPANQQETYDMMFAAYELSEKYSIPVMVRITTRLAHSRSGVERKNVLPEKEVSLPEDHMQFMLLPAVARQRYRRLIWLQPQFEEESERSPYNVYQDGPDKSRGFIACGLAYNYLMENYQDNGCPHPVLKISQYPLPRKKIEKIVSECEEILVLEEGAPVVEEMLKGYLGDFFQNGGTLDAVASEQGKVSVTQKGCPPIKGRLDGPLPRVGELNPGIVRVALGMQDLTGEAIPEVVTPRPPALCKGCSHIDSYNALNEAIQEYGKGHVFSDIGCYTLGFLPPYNAINTCVDMGASVTMAKGAADAGLFPAVGVIGDSTFIHSGITGLLDAVENNANVVIMILENSTTAMTGGQDYPAMGRIQRICEGIGVPSEHVRVLTPLKKHHDEMVRVIKEELAYEGVSVVIPCRECIQTLSRKRK